MTGCSEWTDLIMSEYVVITNQEVAQLISRSNADIERVSDLVEMKAMLQDEIKKNKRFLEKLKQLSKKYRKAVKKIEYQDLLITEISMALKNDQENAISGLLNEGLSHIAFGSLKIEEGDEKVRH